MNVTRGMGCGCSSGSCGCGVNGLGDIVPGHFPIPMNPILAGRPVALAGLGMDSYAVVSWNPPSQSSADGYFGNGGAGPMTINQPGSAANNLANATPDGATPTGVAVVNAFSNNYGGAQPGVLPLDPNQTANSLSFVQPLQPSLQCQITNLINSNPLMFLGIVFGTFYLANQGSHKVREYHAKRKAAKGVAK